MPSTPPSPWALTNRRGLAILGDTHTPNTPTTPHACVLLLHGFLGYKDYGLLPLLAERLTRVGVLVHRFNFSGSGMTNRLETFARPDLFELDTWTRQVEDVSEVARAVRTDGLPGRGLPLWLIGHSRGGDTAILAAGRDAETAHPELNSAGVVTINAPADCNRLSDEARTQLLAQGHLEIRSGRTGQTLRLGRAWLDEQQADPAAHDLERLAAKMTAPLLVLQGDSDDTVPISDAHRLASAARTSPVILPGGTHVLNVPNPATEATRADPGPVFEAAFAAIRARLVGPEE